MEVNQKSQNKSRWGMLGGQLLSHYELIQLQNEKPKITTWDSFDHSLSLYLGFSRSTFIACRRPYEHIVIKSCATEEYTPERKLLVGMHHQRNNAFLNVHCAFEHLDRTYVGSEVFDVSLSDLIDCTIPINELHLSTILKPIVKAINWLYQASDIAGMPVVYGSLVASNVFIKRDGTIKLAAFGERVKPEPRCDTNQDKDRYDIASLAAHMITRVQGQPTVGSKQKMISTLATGGRSLDAAFEPSPSLVDFLEFCEQHGSTIQKISKHQFLLQEAPHSISLLVMNAERTASRPCYLGAT